MDRKATRSRQEKKNKIENKNTRDQIIENWTKDARIITHFWNLWRKKYIETSRDRRVYHNQSRVTTKRSPQIDEIVILADSTPRSQ